MNTQIENAGKQEKNRKAIILLGNCGGDVGRRSKEILEAEVGKTKAIDLGKVDWMVFNTEQKSLEETVRLVQPKHSLLLGPKACKGEGAGFRSENGLKAFNESKKDLKKMFIGPDGKPIYDFVLIVHSTLKGTGGGASLPFGRFLRDELKIDSVLFQSIKPSSGEASIPQRRQADAVTTSIIQAGFPVIEIDNESAYSKAEDDASMEDVYRMLDMDPARSIQACLFVLLNPGAADASDFKNWIIGDKKGKRIITGYASFDISRFSGSDPGATDQEFEAGLNQAFDCWAFNFPEASYHGALIVYYGNSFWNKGRVRKLQDRVQTFADQKQSPHSDSDVFHPIFGRQNTTDNSEVNHAFLAVMFCGPDENSAEFQAHREAGDAAAVKPKEVSEEKPIPMPDQAASKEEGSDDLALVSTLEGKKKIILDQLSTLGTSAASDALSSVQNMDAAAFVESQKGTELENIIYEFSNLLLGFYSKAGKFQQEVYIPKVTNPNRTFILKDRANREDIKNLLASINEYQTQYHGQIRTRFALLENFDENLVFSHLANPIKVASRAIDPVGAAVSASAGNSGENVQSVSGEM